MNNTEFVRSLPLQHFLSFLCVSCHFLKEAQVSGDYHQNEPIVTGDMGDIMGVNKDISLLSFLPSCCCCCCFHVQLSAEVTGSAS